MRNAPKNLEFIFDGLTGDVKKNGWQSIEVSPCTENEEDGVMVCKPEEAQFWSIYVRSNGLASCIADLPTEKLANDLKDIILRAAQIFKPETV